MEKRDRRENKPWLKWAIVAAVVVGIGVFAGLMISHATMPVRIVKVESTNALSTRAQGADVKTTFKNDEPIMLTLEYKDAKVGSGIGFEITDQYGRIERSGSTTDLRAEESHPTEGKRYISIVNTGENTKLESGKYHIKLIADGREIGSHQIEIE